MLRWNVNFVDLSVMQHVCVPCGHLAYLTDLSRAASHWDSVQVSLTRFSNA